MLHCEFKYTKYDIMWERCILLCSISIHTYNIRSTLKAPITTAADDIYKDVSIFFFREKRLDVSSESGQRINMKNQA